MKPAIELAHVTKNIGNKTIIDDVSLMMYPGEVYGLLGPNGAGKTTTIRMMVGLMKTTRGKITISGKDLHEDFEGAVSKVGAVVENPEMYDYLTGYENLIHYQRMSKGVSKERLQEVVNLVDLSKRIHEKVRTYSLGMRQRLGLAQALLHKPDLLILDEPTNGLDPAGIREIRSYLKKLAHEEGICVVVSSHLLSEMEKMCDRIAVIQEGKIIQVSHVNDFVKQVEDQWYLEAEPKEKVIALLKKDHHLEMKTKDKGFHLKIKRENIPALLNRLTSEEISVYQIREADKNTLEEQFLMLTGGGHS
ncbi:bacitracin ABC transporter ATP-binding protein [Salipaludibacillus keqinensis]|uniref:Bacitracin ABC transporter ATP-binding protein n=1 Tax=Salipaludibacillus keqinensis TaxID=2045207 RepID=A0A323TMG5_9BACI|nr:ABC transporter ATP-binding protein [Salipaludibacillus keqinensis]PYZ95246.1 bacitracin ABC transporter ATP-binding protein [Salipaludibacillus keqinensis]